MMFCVSSPTWKVDGKRWAEEEQELFYLLSKLGNLLK